MRIPSQEECCSIKDLLRSFRFRIISLLVLFALALNVFLLINNQYAISLVRNQVVQSNQNLVSLYMNQIDKELDVVDAYHNKLIGLNTDLFYLGLSIDEYEQDYYSAKIRLANEIRDGISSYNQMDMIFVYSVPNEDLMTRPAESVTYSEVELWESHLMALVTDQKLLDSQKADGWFMTQIGTTSFLCRIRKMDDVLLGAIVKTDKIMVPLALVDLGDDGAAVIVDENFQPTTQIDFIVEDQVSFDFAGEDYLLTGQAQKYLVVGALSEKGQFGLAAMIPEAAVLKRLPYFQNISRLVPIITMGIVMIWLLIIAQFFFKPVQRLMTAMKTLERGDFQARVPFRKSSAEFELMNKTFNDMASQIKDLKIEVYEDKLNIQQAEMEQLKLQINPHFFLNSLNIIYQMANERDYALIQEMTSSLVDYFRFIFKSGLTYVVLEDEIRHTRNYLKIQELRFPEHLTFEIDMPEYLSRYLVPPLLIQSFVENAIKYALSLEEVLHILIQVDLVGTLEVPQLEIKIQDNGPGFSETMLSQLRQPADASFSNGDKIGIRNIQRRLHILYQGQARIEFANAPEGGAIVTITLPFKIE